MMLVVFFFNDTATTEIDTDGHTLSLHDARPIYRCVDGKSGEAPAASEAELRPDIDRLAVAARVGERLEPVVGLVAHAGRSEEHTSELQSLMRISYAVFCLKKTNQYE